MNNKEFILEIIRLLKPEFYNKITWSLVSLGIIMLSTPLWLDIVLEFINEEYNKQIKIDSNPFLGLFLIVIALIYNYFSNRVKILQSFCNKEFLVQLGDFYNCKMYLLNNYYRPEQQQVKTFDDIYSKLIIQIISKYPKLENEFELLATYSLPSKQSESGGFLVHRKDGINEFDEKYKQFIRKIK